MDWKLMSIVLKRLLMMIWMRIRRNVSVENSATSSTCCTISKCWFAPEGTRLTAPTRGEEDPPPETAEEEDSWAVSAVASGQQVLASLGSALLLSTRHSLFFTSTSPLNVDW